MPSLRPHQAVPSPGPLTLSLTAHPAQGSRPLSGVGACHPVPHTLPPASQTGPSLPLIRNPGRHRQPPSPVPFKGRPLTPLGPGQPHSTCTPAQPQRRQPHAAPRSPQCSPINSRARSGVGRGSRAARPAPRVPHGQPVLRGAGVREVNGALSRQGRGRRGGTMCLCASAWGLGAGDPPRPRPRLSYPHPRRRPRSSAVLGARGEGLSPTAQGRAAPPVPAARSRTPARPHSALPHAARPARTAELRACLVTPSRKLGRCSPTARAGRAEAAGGPSPAPRPGPARAERQGERRPRGTGRPRRARAHTCGRPPGDAAGTSVRGLRAPWAGRPVPHPCAPGRVRRRAPTPARPRLPAQVY